MDSAITAGLSRPLVPLAPEVSELQIDSSVSVSLSERRHRIASPMTIDVEKIKVMLCARSSM